MARTKQAARKTPKNASTAPPPPPPPPPDISRLLQLMGFPAKPTTTTNYDELAKTVQEVDHGTWASVMERLSSHPEEASIVPTPDWEGKYPLFLALANEATPITPDAVEAFVQAHPDIVTHPRSQVLWWAHQNPNTNPRVIDILLQHNPHLCGSVRTRTFQIMGFPAEWISHFQSDHAEEGVPEPLHTVDWEALLSHLEEHPEEARILCKGWNRDELLFPLEAALHKRQPEVPLRVVQLLLQLCPEAVTISDSSALFWACGIRQYRQNADVVLAILRANPSMAEARDNYSCFTGGEELPMNEAVSLACAAQVLPELIQAYPQALLEENGEGYIPLQAAAERHPISSDAWRILLEEGERVGVGNDVNGGQVFVSFDGHFDGCAMSHIMFKLSMTRDHPDFENTEEFAQAWQNICLCFQAAGAHKTRLDPSRMWEHPLLHGVIEFGRTPFEFERVFEQEANRNFDHVDGLGRTPLVVAIDVAGNAPDDYDATDRDALQYHKVLEKLLGGSKASARRPLQNGSLPLHHALHSGVGFADGLEHIVTAYPEALSVPDPTTNLIPCLLAAVGERARVDTIYCLMVERPNLIADPITEMRNPP